MNADFFLSAYICVHPRLHDRFRSFVGLVTAVFVRAVTEGALLLRGLLQEERRVTLRTRLEDRLFPVKDVAGRIFRTPVKRFAALRFLDDDLAFATRTRTRHADRLLLDVFTLRIIRAGDKLSKAPDTLHELRTINRTLLVERYRRRCGNSSLPNLADVPTLGITSATEERTKAPALQLHRLATELARLRFCSLVARDLRLRRISRAVRTGRRLGVTRGLAVETFQVWTKAPPLLDHARRVALQTDFFSRNVLLFDVFDVTLKLFQVAFKLVVELTQCLGPTDLSVFYLVELFFHARRVTLVEEIVEAAVDQEIVDGLPEGSRMKTALEFLDVLALLDSRHDRRIG